MKVKKTLISLIIILTIFLIPQNIFAKESVTVHFFYSNECAFCTKENEQLERLSKKHSNLIIKKYEISTSVDNNKKLNLVKDAFGDDNSYIPYTVIGTNQYIGYNENILKRIERAIDYYSLNKHRDIVTEIISNNFEIGVDTFDKDDIKEETFKIPFLGNIDPKSVSLPLVTIVIAVVDGFNPCAMWVLILLISVLIGMKDKKKMLILGFTFLIVSAFIYLLFMLAWLKITISVISIGWIKTFIAVMALIGGAINLRSFFKSLKEADGCDVVDDNKRTKIIAKVRKFTTEKSLLLAIIGVVALAISVNLIELACSAGLPLIFTQILAINNLTTVQYSLYMLLYILFFLIDDIIIFLIAIFTFEVTGISTKYTKYSNLIGGIIMIIIGILLIVNPQLLSF